MIAYLLIVVGFLMRLIPHVPNIAPIAAIAIFAGAYLNKKIVPWVPLAIMVASDIILGLHNVVFYTWGAFILIGYIGGGLKNRVTPGRIFGTTAVSALLFFAISNFGVWLSGGLYPHTLAGFTSCYVNALPFLRNTMISNVVFAFVFFGAYEVAKRSVKDVALSKVLLVH